MKKHVKAERSFWIMGFLAAVSLVWLIIRTGGKPSRITYPCQKAAVANINVFLLALPLLSLPKLKATLPHLDSRLLTTILLVGSLLLAFGSIAFVSNCVPIQNSSSIYSVPVSIVLPTRNAVSLVGSSDPSLFFVQNAYGSQGSLDSAVSSLVQLMAAHSLSFYKTASQPSGLIGKNDVVILKVNSEWDQRGGTNTDLVKSIIKEIVNHPEGFTGEIVIADNGQWTARTSDTDVRGYEYAAGGLTTDTNSYDHVQSFLTVANYFSGLGYRVSVRIWDDIRDTAVSEYSAGDLRNGYVVSSTAESNGFKYSYPKFETTYGTYISLKNGIWSGSSYDNIRLKLINVPVLKSHGNYGVSGSIKNYMGVQSNDLSSGHGYMGLGGMGDEMADVRFPTLNILDCLYVDANPYESGIGGPDDPYTRASYTNTICASLDPVALDYYASKYILIPAAQAKGYTTYNSINPDYAGLVSGLDGSFHTYLVSSMNELNNHGFQVTMNEDEMNVYVSSPLGLVRDLNTNLGYDTIQAAIDANETLGGHTVSVEAGTYYEHIVIDKSIVLTGENEFSTIIDGNKTGSVITITAGNVKISGFTIQRGGFTPSGSESGIYVNSSNNTISFNNITNNMVGITLTSANNNVVTNNNIANNTWGISIAQSKGNKIYHNDVLKNTVKVQLLPVQAQPVGVTASSYGSGHPPSLAVDGIENPSNYWGTDATVPQGVVPQWLNVDLGSLLTISKITTHFYDGDDRTYTYYIEASNDSSSWTMIVPTKTGSVSVTDTVSQVGARFVRITITANTANPAAHIEQIKIYRSNDSAGSNSWDNGYPLGGNYWSDYTLPDLHSGPNQDQPGSDGIIDTPYTVATGSVDRYPLVRALRVTIPGDLNGDGRVSLLDLVILAQAYGSKPGDPKWNPNADIYGNGIVGLNDLVVLAQHYGQHYP